MAMPFSPRRLGAVAYSLVMFALVSALAGVLIAGLFVPVAGIAGVSSKAAADELDKLPAELATPIPPTRTRVLMANGKTLAYFYDQNRIYVGLNKIAPVMRQSILAIEDHRFYEHGALDLKGTLRALIRNTSGDGATQGGSSITQQYVKMELITACEAKADPACIEAAREVSVERKIRELRYAIALEKRFNKDQILERYLNIAYFGQGAYGVEAAARYYFRTTAAKLTLTQAAMLAGLVQNPDANNPVRNAAAALDRRDVVLNRMAELGMISSAQAAQGKKAKFDRSKVNPTPNGCIRTRYPFLCDFVYRTLLRTPSLGKTPEEREKTVKRAGLTIETAIDPKTQDMAQKSVSNVVGAKDPIIATMNMIQPGTGLIVAMAQSRPEMGSSTKKGETYWNFSADATMGGRDGFQAGSTFKAFTSAAALEKGIPLTKRYNAPRTRDYSGRSFESCEGREQVYGKWRVSNSTGTNGTMNMYKAAQMSVNNYYVPLALDTGLCRVTKMAEKTGVKLGTRNRGLVEYYQHIPSFTLGTAEVSPLSMAEAYATFAARGMHCNPIIIDKIKTPAGKELEPPSADCKRVMDRDVADGVNKLLASVMTQGTGRRARTSDGRPQAGKTGTIDSNEAVWFIGYTPEIAGAAMISIDNRKKPFIRGKSGFRRSGVKGYQVPSTDFVLEGSGSADAGMKIWKPTMERYLRDVPRTSFKDPSREIERGKQVRVPSLFGLSISAATRKLEREGFSVENLYVYSDAVPRGSWIGFSPGSGSLVGEFSTIYSVWSRGRNPADIQREREAAAERAREARERARKAEEERKQEEAERKKKEEKKKEGG